MTTDHDPPHTDAESQAVRHQVHMRQLTETMEPHHRAARSRTDDEERALSRRGPVSS